MGGGELQDTASHLVIVGRGRVIADTSLAGLLAAASGDRVMVRTTAPAGAAAVLERAGAAVSAAGADGRGGITVTGLTTEQVVAVLGAAAVPFSEVSAHRASLEEAYLELTSDMAEFRAAAPPGRAGARPSSPAAFPQASNEDVAR
jgi:ABC-2 type transport system ATP-binding protein